MPVRPAITSLTCCSDEVWEVTGHRRSGTVAGLASTLPTVRPDGGLLVGENGALRPSHGPGPGAGGPKALAFSADGAQLAAGDRTGRVVLWDGDLRHRGGTLPDVFPASPPDSPETVSALALSPDGRTLAAASDTGTLQLWDTRTWQPLGGPLQTPGEAIDSLVFAGDSRTLYASGAHVPLQRYTVDPARAVRRACARAGGDLRREQWRTYVQDTAYRKVCD